MCCKGLFLWDWSGGKKFLLWHILIGNITKSCLIGNKELGKVQREFTVVVIKIKNVSAFIAEFSPPSLCMSKKKRKKRKRGIQMLQENYFVMCRQAKRSYNCIAIKWFFPSINYPITSAVVVIILLLPTKKDGIFLWLCKGVFLFKYFILGLFIDRFYLICQVLLKIYFFFIPDLNTGFGTLTHISKSWQIFPSGEREKRISFFLPKPYSDFVCMHTKTAS